MGDPFEWTPRRVQELREAWAAGLTASVIAHALGIGRGSVIGKVHRLGLARRGPSKRPNEAAVRRSAGRAPARTERSAARTEPALAGNRPISLAQAPAKPVRRQQHGPINDSPAIPLVRSSRRMSAVAAAAGAKTSGKAVPAAAGAAPRPPAHAGCGILQLTNTTCRWPVQPGGLGDPRYCGEPGADLSARTPYCAAHMRAAYIFTPRPRARGKAS